MSFALDDLDRKVLRHLPDRPGIFVEAGAHDGLTQSNTAMLEFSFGWTGLLVEPIPELAARCRLNRPGALVEQAALVAPDYGQDSIRMTYCNRSSIVEGGRGSRARDAAWLEACRRIPDQRHIQIVDVVVPAGTLSSILDSEHLEIDSSSTRWGSPPPRPRAQRHSWTLLLTRVRGRRERSTALRGPDCDAVPGCSSPPRRAGPVVRRSTPRPLTPSHLPGQPLGLEQELALAGAFSVDLITNGTRRVLPRPAARRPTCGTLRRTSPRMSSQSRSRSSPRFRGGIACGRRSTSRKRTETRAASSAETSTSVSLHRNSSDPLYTVIKNRDARLRRISASNIEYKNRSVPTFPEQVPLIRLTIAGKQRPRGERRVAEVLDVPVKDTMIEDPCRRRRWGRGLRREDQRTRLHQ